MLDTYFYVEHMVIGYKTNVSNTFETLFKIFVIKWKHLTPYHIQCMDGLISDFHIGCVCQSS